MLIATDAWRPQINGVVRTLEGLVAEAPRLGAAISVVGPERFASAPMPGYPDIRLAAPTPSAIARAIREAQPDAIHIATEGPVGFMARRFCIRHGMPFTTCYHTRFPEYLAARLPVPLSWSYAAMRRFHKPAVATMAATPALARELQGRGFGHLVLWTRGVDVPAFAAGRPGMLKLPGPIFLCVARLAVEKNIDAFLALDLPGSKVVVGDGPARTSLQARFPDARFLGMLSGQALADAYASADVFVFPSRTDTFGLVMLEALAAGAPVAAYPVTGPRDVLGTSGCGVLDEDLRAAALAALAIPRDRCRAYAQGATMTESCRSFLDNVSLAAL
ncbi:glycosyltransferase family 1 protein [Alsobacter sp. KACC 23698]|uniref:Glycosyltransferase family 1 protein n=1 Tax=Alsobacter sp. KACC 23698 TaxID=3149229 RepID=A0AAU7JJY1_9HYPH